MGLRRYAFLLASTLLGATVAALPGVAGSETAPTVNAESNAKTCGGTYYPNCWLPSQVELASPGSVGFQNASGEKHGVVWLSGPVTPTCTGVPVGSSEVSFNGTCSFPQAGTYRFYCFVHGPSMSGTIIVNSTGTTTPTTTATQPGGATTGTQPPATTSTPTGPSSLPLAPGTVAGVSLGASQRGRAVRGSVRVASAYAGGRLEVDLLASRASLAGAGAAAPARVGRIVRTSLRAGKMPFSVPVNARARGALARHRRLPLTVEITLAPASGPPSFASRRVTLHP